MFFSFSPPVMYETPEPAGGGAGIAPAVQAGDPPAQGGGGGDDAFWGMFPDVPVEHRELLRPHITKMQGHVTKLEQEHAPFKTFSDAGIDPQGAQGLIQFSNDFDRDPLGMWMRIGEMLQKGQNGQPGVLNPELDLEHLAALARGEDPDAMGEQLDQGQVPEGDPNNPLMQTVQQLQAKIEELENGRQQELTQRQQNIQDQLLNKRMGSMREALKEAGYPEDAITDESLTSAIITHRGDVTAATQAFIDLRSNMLKGFVQQNTSENDDLELPNGIPDTPVREKPRQDDSWAKARVQATSRLRRANSAV